MGVILEDISKGKEARPVRVINDIDDEAPPNFVYMTNYLLRNVSIFSITPDMYENHTRRDKLRRCACEDACKPGTCSCIQHGIQYGNGNSIKYECTDLCNCCNDSCRNRDIQDIVVTKRFEVFKTSTMGWGLRCLDEIKEGEVLMEYIGEVMTDELGEEYRYESEYFLSMLIPDWEHALRLYDEFQELPLRLIPQDIALHKRMKNIHTRAILVEKNFVIAKKPTTKITDKNCFFSSKPYYFDKIHDQLNEYEEYPDPPARKVWLLPEFEKDINMQKLPMLSQKVYDENLQIEFSKLSQKQQQYYTNLWETKHAEYAVKYKEVKAAAEKTTRYSEAPNRRLSDAKIRERLRYDMESKLKSKRRKVAQAPIYKAFNDNRIYKTTSPIAKERTSKSNDVLLIDPSKYGNIARFINHSCTPNISKELYEIHEAVTYHDTRPDHDVIRTVPFTRLIFVARRNIQPKEELYWDYGHTYFKNKKCLCGSTNCVSRR